MFRVTNICHGFRTFDDCVNFVISYVVHCIHWRYKYLFLFVGNDRRKSIITSGVLVYIFMSIRTLMVNIKVGVTLSQSPRDPFTTDEKFSNYVIKLVKLV